MKNEVKVPVKIQIKEKPLWFVSPLWVAVYKGYDIELIRFLIDCCCCNIEERSENDDVDDYEDKDYPLVNTTPLFVACYTRRYSTARLLIENGADINTTNDFYETPLMLSFRDTDFCRYLVSRHASLDLRDRTGYTALHWASLFQNNESILYLLKCGANPYLKSKQNENFFVHFTIYTASNYLRSDEEKINQFNRLLSFSLSTSLINHSYKNVLYNLFAAVMSDLSTKKQLWNKLSPVAAVGEKKKKTRYELFYWKDIIETTELNERRFRNIIGYDDDDNLYIQSVIICQKILNHNHTTVTKTLLDLAINYYVDERNLYSKAMEILTYALSLLRNDNDDNEEAYENICKSFWLIMYKYVSVIEFKDVFPFFCYFTKKWTRNERNILKRARHDETLNYFCLVTFLIFRITTINNTQKASFTTFIKNNVVPLKLKTYYHRDSILHLFVKSHFIFKNFDSDIIKNYLYFLIAVCREDVNVLNVNNVTPLRLAFILGKNEKITGAMIRGYIDQNVLSPLKLTDTVVLSKNG